MHEYLHKYFEKIKKLENFFIHNMRPLTYVSPPPGRGVRRVLPPALSSRHLYSSSI